MEETLHKEHPITGENIRVSLDECKKPPYAYSSEQIMMVPTLFYEIPQWQFTEGCLGKSLRLVLSTLAWKSAISS